MKRFLAAALACLAVCCAGCTGEKNHLLQEYSARLEEKLEPENPIARLEGNADGLCLVESVSQERVINASAAGLFSLSDQRTIYAQNPYERLRMASITKIMTALLTVRLADMREEITLGDEVVITEPGASLSGFVPGDSMTVEDVLYAALLQSGNDAANALGVAVSGNLPDFVRLMNETAAELFATDTHFANTHGLDAEGHYSSVYDLYLIFRACINEPAFLRTISRPSYSYTYRSASGTDVSVEMTNTNWYKNRTATPPEGITVVGGKTGHTAKSGYSLIILARDQAENEYIGVILGAESRESLYEEMNKLLSMIP